MVKNINQINRTLTVKVSDQNSVHNCEFAIDSSLSAGFVFKIIYWKYVCNDNNTTDKDNNGHDFIIYF